MNKPYTPKPNTGSLFKNKYKVKPNHPDLTGKVHLDRTLLTRIIHDQQGETIVLECIAYKTTLKDTQTFLSLILKEPPEAQPKTETLAELEDDLPF
jgi:hypothetical protein